MARVPVIDSPCPIANRPLPAGASDHCEQCDRTVYNLDRMSDRERREFMNGCSGKVCVAYSIARIPVRHRGLAVAALAAAALASLPAAADPAEVAEAPSDSMSPMPGSAQLPDCDSDFLGDVLVTGGVTRGDQADWVDDGKDAPPDLPTIEDDGR